MPRKLQIIVKKLFKGLFLFQGTLILYDYDQREWESGLEG